MNSFIKVGFWVGTACDLAAEEVKVRNEALRAPERAGEKAELMRMPCMVGERLKGDDEGDRDLQWV